MSAPAAWILAALACYGGAPAFAGEDCVPVELEAVATRADCLEQRAGLIQWGRLARVRISFAHCLPAPAGFAAEARS